MQIAGGIKGLRRGEEGGFAKDPGRSLADEDGHVRADLVDEAVVVGVAVGDDDAHEFVVPRQETGDIWQRYMFIGFGPQGPTEIEQQPLSVDLKLEAVAANLSGPPVDARPHLSGYHSR